MNFKTRNAYKKKNTHLRISVNSDPVSQSPEFRSAHLQGKRADLFKGGRTVRQESLAGSEWLAGPFGVSFSHCLLAGQDLEEDEELVWWCVGHHEVGVGVLQADGGLPLLQEACVQPKLAQRPLQGMLGPLHAQDHVPMEVEEQCRQAHT